MKATDVDRAQQELIRLRELESALTTIEETGCFTVKGCKPGAYHGEAGRATHLYISGGRREGYSGLTTGTGYASIRDAVTAAYREEIAQTRAKLERLGVIDTEAAAEPTDEVKAA